MFAFIYEHSKNVWEKGGKDGGEVETFAQLSAGPAS